VTRIFYWGPRPKPRAGWDSWEGGSNPRPPRPWGQESAVSSPAGFGAEQRPPKGFPLFSALRMASTDTIILLTVDYRAAKWGRGQVPHAPPCVHSGDDDDDDDEANRVDADAPQ